MFQTIISSKEDILRDIRHVRCRKYQRSSYRQKARSLQKFTVVIHLPLFCEVKCNYLMWGNLSSNVILQQVVLFVLAPLGYF